MADSTGINAAGGGYLSDWAHVQQSIGIILTTPLGSRVMRRDFGSLLYDYIDAKMSARNILGVYVASAMAIDKWEPRFRMTRGSIEDARPSGVLIVNIYGDYYPRGHLGDYSIKEDASVRVIVG
jgi:phage baseplate assembly protein W